MTNLDLSRCLAEILDDAKRLHEWFLTVDGNVKGREWEIPVQESDIDSVSHSIERLRDLIGETPLHLSDMR